MAPPQPRWPRRPRRKTPEDKRTAGKRTEDKRNSREMVQPVAPSAGRRLSLAPLPPHIVLCASRHLSHPEIGDDEKGDGGQMVVSPQVRYRVVPGWEQLPAGF